MSNLEFAGDSGSLSDINATQGEFRDQIAALNDLMRQIAGNAAVSPGDAAQVDPLNAPFTLYVNPYTGSDEFVGGAYNTFEEGVTEAEILESKVKRLEKQRLTCGFTPQRPFKTINRAVIEAAIITSKDWYSFTSRQAQLDCVSIVLSTGVHKLYNDPGQVSTTIASWGLSKDPTIAELIAFNPPTTGGVLLPRGVSLCAADLRKTSIRPNFVPAVADEVVTITNGVANYSNRTAMFKMTGTGYYFGFSIFDNVNEERSHHLLDAFAFATEAELDDFYAKTLSGVGDGADLANNLTVTRTTEFEIVAPIVRGETPTQKWDSTDSASPYIFNVSIRSNYGLGGAFIDGARVGGLKSMVCANFTGVSLQKDMSCWQIYVGGQWVEPTYTEYIAADPDNTRMNPARLSRHISAINDAFIQEVSVFAIGQGIHHFCDTGGEITITNSNSSFGGCAAYSRGYKTFAFPTDKNWAISAIKVPLDLQEKTGNVRRIFLGTISEVTASKITLVNDLAIDSSSTSTPEILLRDGYSFASGTFIWAENPLGDPWYAPLATNAWESTAASEIDITAAFQGNDPTTDAEGVNLLLGKRVYLRRLVDTRNPSERRVSLVANNTSSARLPQRNSILQTDPNRTGGSISTELSNTGPQTFAVSNAGEHADPGVTRSAEFTIRRSAPNTNYVQNDFYPSGTIVRANNKHFIASRDVTADSASPDPNVWLETFVHTESDYDAEDPITQEARLIIIDFDNDTEPFSENLGINFADVYNGNSYKSSTDYKGVNAFLVALGFTQAQADAALVPRAQDSRTLDPTSAVDFPDAPSGGAADGRGNWAIEFRRPSTLRLFAHAWEYTGFLNYSKAVPSAQQDLGPQNAFTYFFTNDGGGRVVPQGSNENGFNITPRGLEDIETGATLTVDNIGSSSIELSQKTSFDELVVKDLTVDRISIVENLEFNFSDPIGASINEAGVVKLASRDQIEDASPAGSDREINANPEVITARGLAYWRQVNNFLSAPLETPRIYVDPLNGLEYTGTSTQQLQAVFAKPPTDPNNKVKSLALAARYANSVYSPSVTVEFRVGPGAILEDAEFETKAELRAWDYSANNFLNDSRFGGTDPFFGENGTTYSNFKDASKQPTFATGFRIQIIAQGNDGALINVVPVRLIFNQEATVIGFVWLGISDTILQTADVPNDWSGFDTTFTRGGDSASITVEVSEWRDTIGINYENALNYLLRSIAVRTKVPETPANDPPEIWGIRTNPAIVFRDTGKIQNCAFGAMAPCEGSLAGSIPVNRDIIRGTSSKPVLMDGIRLIGNVKISGENNNATFTPGEEGGPEDYDTSKIRLRIANTDPVTGLKDASYRYTGFARRFYGLGPNSVEAKIALAGGTRRQNIGGSRFTGNRAWNNWTLLKQASDRTITEVSQSNADSELTGSGYLNQGPAFEFLINTCAGTVSSGASGFNVVGVVAGEFGGIDGFFGKYQSDLDNSLGTAGVFNYSQGYDIRGAAIIDQLNVGNLEDRATLFRNPGVGETPRNQIVNNTVTSNDGFDYYAKTLTAPSVVSGARYQILFAGDTDFTTIGASSNAVGTVFDATGTVTGTGVVCELVAGTSTPVKLGAGEVQDNGGEESPVGVFPELNIKLIGYEKGIETTDARTVYFRNIF